MSDNGSDTSRTIAKLALASFRISAACKQLQNNLQVLTRVVKLKSDREDPVYMILADLDQSFTESGELIDQSIADFKSMIDDFLKGSSNESE